jgi:hypothetical protein
VHPRPSPQLGCSLVGCGKHLQFNVKKGHFSIILCNMWDIIQFIPFACVFYVINFPFLYNHCNRDGDVIIIPITMGIHQNNPLGALFTLAHFRFLRSTTNHFPSCLFPSIVYDIHIISPLSIISSAYEHFEIELCAIDLSI